MSLASQKDYYTAEEYAAAKNVNIASFLQSIGYGLTKLGAYYKGKLHDSLVIHTDGRWYWNSRDLHGHSPIELYKHILLNDFGYTNEISAAIAAVKQLSGSRGFSCTPAAFEDELQKNRPAGVFALPAPYQNNRRVIAYLCKTRGLDSDIVLSLIKSGQIYETIQSWNSEKSQYEDGLFHNAVFVAFDKTGQPRGAFLRGTISHTVKPFKREINFSDKSYLFTIPWHMPNTDRVYVFESGIDAISHATINKWQRVDWRGYSRVSLGGISFLGLDRFLSEHPQITHIISCLDNDETGNRRSMKIMTDYSSKGFLVSRETPILKDFNEDLLHLPKEQAKVQEYEWP